MRRQAMTAINLVSPLLLFALLLCDCCLGFTAPTGARARAMIQSNQLQPSPTMHYGNPLCLSLAKKRRRRKGDNDDSSQSDDLPDFDLDEDEELPKKKTTPIPSEPISGEISSAMMGSANKPVRSVEQLIKDRSLEKNFQFDEPEDTSLPDLAVLAKEQNAQMGRKQAKRDARVAAALERKGEEKGSNPLSQIPFITDEKGEVSAIKILEAGTWLGIFLLVGWEIYINSPFFDRVAPLAPFLYE